MTDPNATVVHTCQFSEAFAAPTSTPGNNDGKTVRSGDWKLIRFDDGTTNLFNFPNENLNLSDGSLTPVEQANFDALNLKLDCILAGPILLGDVNLDVVVDFLDISPFIGALTSGNYQHEVDCDQNGIVDFFDISPFIAILSGQ